ncbi:MAG: hypothetical protein LXA50_24760 [Betaproteobacteria bacterium]|jgi:hypothetical protein|nr:hypothetical protein [Betaproteobacteria bacterium]
MVKRLSRLVRAALVALAAASTSAKASMLITLDRISDTQVRMTGTGSVGGGGASVFNTLVLDGGVVAGSGSGSASGNFAIGGYDVLSWGTFSGSLALFSTGTFTEAQSPTGSGVLSLDTGNGIFNPVGSSGALVGNILGGSVADQRLVGRWQIVEAPVAIPLPWHQRVSRSVVPRGGRDHHRRIVLSNTPRSHGP